MKFKVWDSIDKKFTVAKGQFCIGQNGTLYEACDFEGISKAGSRYTPVFFTGQTDERKFDVFYGDIVKDRVAGILTIEWDKELSIMFLKIVANGMRVDYSPYYKIKIIGNKYENPELLEK